MKLTVAGDHNAESQGKPIVLVADDSRVMRVALTRILKEQYSVLEAEHGEDAWAKLNAEPGVQMVFSDLSMPELDGFGLLGRIRGCEQARIREVPFIVITGNEDDQAVREKAMAGGATDFILKPFQSVEIKARAKAHVDHLRKLGAVSQALEDNAVRDDGTGLANRRHFGQRGQEALAFAARQQLPVAVVQIQLDRFQALRQAQGEERAQEALQIVADILSSRTRTEDTVGHFGDGLFVLASPAADQVGAAQLAGRIAEAVTGVRLGTGTDSQHLTASIGIAVAAPGSADDVEELLGRAERLLASAVRKGGNTVVAEDYVQALQSEKGTAPSDAQLKELETVRAQLRNREQEMAQLQAKYQEQERSLGEALQSVRAQSDTQRAEVEGQRAELTQARNECQRMGSDLERALAELESLRYDASTAESTRSVLQHSVDELRAQLEETATELEEHRQRLESELSNRHAVESELAKLKLQDVARREAAQKLADRTAEAAHCKLGLGARLRGLFGRRAAG